MIFKCFTPLFYVLGPQEHILSHLLTFVMQEVYTYRMFSVFWRSAWFGVLYCEYIILV